MPRDRIVIFATIVLLILAVPSLLPVLAWGPVLPWWAFVLYAVIVLLDAGVYLLNRCVLIDRYFIKGRIGRYVLLNMELAAIVAVLQFSVIGWTDSFILSDGSRVGDVMGFSARLSQRVLSVGFLLLTVLVALAVALSDQWRYAAFKYREVARDKEDLEKSVDALKGEVAQLQRRQSEAASPRPDSISVKVDLMMTRIPLEEILCVRGDGDYVVIHRTDGSRPMTLMTLKALEKQLPQERFCRVHRSWIANLDKISGLRGGKILLAGQEIPLSDSCKAAFFELLSRRSILLRPE